MEKVDAIIVGAGVVGLAIASEIARGDREIYVLEKEKDYGQATSSRNSEVIHAGLYYQKGSLKAELCVRANPMIYRICRENNIAHKMLGKIVVANGEAEVRQLEGIIRNARECGARDLEFIDPDRVHGLEPKVRADAAILSPTTGIVDAHGLMDHFYKEARRKCGVDPLVLDTEVTGLEQRGDGYAVEAASGGESYKVEARVVVNAAGLHADRVAEMVGIDVERAGYRLHWCKGDYFSLTGSPPARMLVYPPPAKDERSLGIHTVPDLTGRLRFGPNAYYVDKIDYRVESEGDVFWRDIVKYLPTIRRGDLHPDMSGIRAKLQGPGDPARDFVIRHEEDMGLPGLINLIGIESPGLTSTPAIAEMVAGMVDELL